MQRACAACETASAMQARIPDANTSSVDPCTTTALEDRLEALETADLPADGIIERRQNSATKALLS